MAKVNFFDKRVIKKFLEITAVVSGTLSFVVIFVDVPAEWKLKAGLAFLAILALTYLVIWLWSNNLNSIDINVEGSDVAIKTGDIFQQPGLKAIAFNEYFDTQVDNKIIGETSLNGVFIQSISASRSPNWTATSRNTLLMTAKSWRRTRPGNRERRKGIR